MTNNDLYKSVHHSWKEENVVQLNISTPSNMTTAHQVEVDYFCLSEATHDMAARYGWAISEENMTLRDQACISAAMREISRSMCDMSKLLEKGTFLTNEWTNAMRVANYGLEWVRSELNRIQKDG